MTGTIEFAELAARPWDAVVIGAGPAGGLAAYLLARRGQRVLLVDRKAFPREKACGCCLNSASIEALRSSGLGAVLEGAEDAEQARPLDRLILRNSRRVVELGLPGSLALSRGVLDGRLAQAAVSAGAAFMPECVAHLQPADKGSQRRIVLRKQGCEATVEASLVIASDGLGGGVMDQEPGAKWAIARDAWIGLATTVDAGGCGLPRGTINMFMGVGGYVGVVRMEEGRLHLAAAVHAGACRDAGGPGRMMMRLIGDCGVQVPQLADAAILGTGPLTRRRRVIGGHRVLAAGDACGYVEPFTGEGIAWALRSAGELVRLLPADLADWDASLIDRWRTAHRNVLGRHQLACRAIRYLLHRPRLGAGAVFLAQKLPRLGEWCLRSTDRIFTTGVN